MILNIYQFIVFGHFELHPMNKGTELQEDPSFPNLFAPVIFLNK